MIDGRTRDSIARHAERTLWTKQVKAPLPDDDTFDFNDVVDPEDLLTRGLSDDSVEDLLSAAPAPRRILGDSGAATDLMGKKDINSDCVVKKTKGAIDFDTANATVSSDHEVTYWSKALKQFVTATLLEKSVSVLSI
eukprot:1566138-Heterocapsa_arctica.AAC.1